jgi:hypothetical protein
MKSIFLYSLIFFGAMNCANSEKGKPDVSSIESNIQQKIAKLTSGKYGDVSIAVNGDTVTGVYEYYDKWNQSAKQFTDINVFYFYGRLSNGQFPIKVSWPGEDVMSGTITHGVGIKLNLEDQPNGYAAVDFVSVGYQATNTAIKNWIGIGLIKSEKSYLYKLPTIEKTRIYMVKEDVVKIVEKAQGWSRVEYNPPSNPGKVFTGWIIDSDLYNQDPGKW